LVVVVLVQQQVRPEHLVRHRRLTQHPRLVVAAAVRQVLVQTETLVDLAVVQDQTMRPLLVVLAHLDRATTEATTPL
jgi:hypothetical protein